MGNVIFGRRATFESGFAQVRMPGRRRHAVARWGGGSAPVVCWPGCTEAERQEVVAQVATALIMRRWAHWWFDKRK